jgi:hypothetical protein
LKHHTASPDRAIGTEETTAIKGDTDAIIAKAVGVGEATVRRMEAVRKDDKENKTGAVEAEKRMLAGKPSDRSISGSKQPLRSSDLKSQVNLKQGTESRGDRTITAAHIPKKPGARTDLTSRSFDLEVTKPKSENSPDYLPITRPEGPGQTGLLPRPWAWVKPQSAAWKPSARMTKRIRPALSPVRIARS